MSKNEFICDCSVIHQDVVDETIKICQKKIHSIN